MVGGNGSADGKLPLEVTEGREVIGPLTETEICDTDGALPLEVTKGRVVMGPLNETELCDISGENEVAWKGATVDGREVEFKLMLLLTVENKGENSG